jgi:hypothetical protein
MLVEQVNREVTINCFALWTPILLPSTWTCIGAFPFSTPSSKYHGLVMRVVKNSFMCTKLRHLSIKESDCGSANIPHHL